SATAKVTELIVRSGYDRNKSWRRRSFDAVQSILAHEQGHLDINELHADEFKKLRPSELPAGIGLSGPAAMEDLRQKVQALAARILKESQAEQDLYDAETNHGAIGSQQLRWTAALQKRLKDAKIAYWDSQ